MTPSKHLLRVLVLSLPYVGLLLTWDLAERLTATLVCFAAALAILFYWLRRWDAPANSTILAVATLLRLLLVPLPPSLSDDVYRYVWDGRVAGAGFNPYELEPNATELEPLRNDDWQEMPHRDVATVYPPLALTLFAIAARFPWPILAWKLILVTIDLVACWFVCRLAVLRRGSPGAALAYAWNPLVVIETAGMGHVDALGVAAVVIAVWAIVLHKRSLLSAGAMAAAVLAKLVPLVAVPMWLRRSRRPWAASGLLAVTLALAMAPVGLASRGIPSGYLRFGTSWEFNGPLYEPLWRGLELAGSPELVARRLDLRKQRSGEHEFWNRFYPFNYARFHARLLLLPVLGGLLLLAWRRSNTLLATGMCFEAVLLCSATVYPWYLLWLLPFAAVEGRRAWLVLCSTSVLSYIPQFTEVPLMPWIFLACWGPYAVLRGIGQR